MLTLHARSVKIRVQARNALNRGRNPDRIPGPREQAPARRPAEGRACRMQPQIRAEGRAGRMRSSSLPAPQAPVLGDVPGQRRRSPQQLQAVVVGTRNAGPAGRRHATPNSRGPREPPHTVPHVPRRPATEQTGQTERPCAADRTKPGSRHDTRVACSPTPRPRPGRGPRPR